MSYSILRVARVKTSVNTRGLQRHNQRENKNYNNKDINPEETHRNYDLINNTHIDYNEKITQIIQDNYTQKRKIRKDAVKHVDGLITSDELFFKNMSDGEIKEFFKDSLSFLEEKYGKENMLYATVHLDEKTPHMHFGFVPITDDGRLSAKQILGNKRDMTELQDEFNTFVNSRGYDLERGTSKTVSEKEHVTMDQYKKETKYHQKTLQETKAELNDLENRLNAHISDLRGHTDFEYENEVKVKRGFLTGREELETGRKVFSAEEFERIQQTVTSARNILDDYESLKDQDYYKRYNKLLKQTSNLVNQHKSLKKEHKKVKEKNKELNHYLGIYERGTERLYKVCRDNFKGFERAYNSFSNKLKENDKTKPLGEFMDYVQDNVLQQERKHQKDSGLEL